MPLVPLKHVQEYEGRRIDVLGVVLEWGIPKVTIGSDMKMGMVIVDRSGAELKVTMFLPRADDFPAVIERGDVIHLSRVEVKIFVNELFALFYKRFSKYAIYRGNDVGNYDPYLPQRPSIRPLPLNTMTRLEIHQLRLWYPSFRSSAGKREYLLSMKELTTNSSNERSFFDLVCKVLHITQHDCHEMHLYVWDGTDIPHYVNNKKFYNEDVNPLPIRTDLNSLPHTLLNSFPKAGTILKVTVYVDVQTFAKYFNFNDRWVRLRNISAQYLHSGMWEASTDDLKIRVLPDTDLMVEECSKNYMERLTKSQCMPVCYNPSTTQLTEIVIPNNDRIGYSTLLNVVACEEVGRIFKCVVHVVALRPAEVLDDYRLTLEDPTTRIHAFLTTIDGQHFFDGSVQSDTVINKLNKLLGTPQDELTGIYDFVTPLWIECILKTSLTNPMDVHGSRKYHVIYTKLVS